jgi:hypothetical protein
MTPTLLNLREGGRQFISASVEAREEVGAGDAISFCRGGIGWTAEAGTSGGGGTSDDEGV